MAHEWLIDKSDPPSDLHMVHRIGQPLAEAWSELRRFPVETYGITPALQYGGKRYGWNLQHRKGGRPLCEMYPECGSFTALVVLGKAGYVWPDRAPGTGRHTPLSRWLLDVYPGERCTDCSPIRPMVAVLPEEYTIFEPVPYRSLAQEEDHVA